METGRIYACVISWILYYQSIRGVRYMETSTIAGAALLAQTGQTQQAISMSLMKQAADQQKQMANILAQSATQAAQNAAGSGYAFSTFA